MWIFTEAGFVSAVCESTGSDTVKVRACDRQSLEGLSELGSAEILEWSARDYPYRVIVSKAVLTQWMSATIDQAEYTNFKNQVAQTRGKAFASALSKVWTAMHAVTDTADAKARSLYYRD